MAAIYTPLWEYNLFVTTTLYPVEVLDALELNVTLNNGSLSLVPYSEFEHDHALIDSSYIQLRWFYTDGPYSDDFEHDHGLISSTYVQLRWFYTDGPYNDDFEHDYALISASLINKKIDADTPDESLQLSITISASSTMELI